MTGSPLEWFREDGDWTLPEGREGELVALAVCLPVVAWFVHASSGFSLPWANALGAGGGTGVTDVDLHYWVAAAGGVLGGFFYVASCRDPVVARLPDLDSWSIISLFGGGFGLSALEVLPASNAVVTGLLTAGVTVLVIYLCRLVSPLHEGLSSKRGVEPPAAVELDG